MEEWEALEWEQLRVVGLPLLSGAAFGATPLLWVACRAQPCLVHIFCDTKLQEIWRFPADAVFLSVASGARPQGNHDGAPSLLVITREGCIWIVQLSKTSTGASRFFSKAIGIVDERIQQRHQDLNTLMWDCVWWFVAQAVEEAKDSTCGGDSESETA